MDRRELEWNRICGQEHTRRVVYARLHKTVFWSARFIMEADIRVRDAGEGNGISEPVSTGRVFKCSSKGCSGIQFCAHTCGHQRRFRRGLGRERNLHNVNRGCIFFFQLGDWFRRNGRHGRRIASTDSSQSIEQGSTLTKMSTDRSLRITHCRMIEPDDFASDFPNWHRSLLSPTLTSATTTAFTPTTL